MISPKRQTIIAWIAVAISAIFANLWAFWGINENFHEGWYATRLWDNLLTMIFQYLLLALAFIGLGLIAIRFHRVGAGLSLGIGLFSIWFFHGASLPVHLTISGFFALIALAFFFGEPDPRRWAYAITAGLPCLTLLFFAIEPVLRISGRVDDGNYGARQVTGNGITLVWAPQGPGYPLRGGVIWSEAVRRCHYLSTDGAVVQGAPVDVWRLPTVGEAVRSMQRHNQPAGGTWNASLGQATYLIMPDKETPLWNPHSMVIYWWTATEFDATRAYRAVYSGLITPYPKNMAADYFSFRCVRYP